MRVAILTRGDLFPPNHGAAARIVRSAEALAQAGDTPVLLSDDRDHYFRWNNGWEKVAYGPRLRALEEAPVFRNQARVVWLCEKIGYPREEVFLYRPMVDPAWWLRTLYVGIRERIEVYHAEFPGFAAPAALAARLLGGRSVLVQHNIEHDRLRQTTTLNEKTLFRLKLLERLMMHIVEQVLVLSEEDRTRAEKDGISRDKLCLVPHGVDLNSYQGTAINLRERYRLGQGPILFFHGTLHYRPNTEAVQFLARNLVPQLPPTTTLLIAGLSPMHELSGPQLQFTGPVADLAQHIAGADICLCPLFAGGGTRMKLLEYFAAGKPVVSTHLGAEGLPVVHNQHLLLTTRAEFVPTTLKLLHEKPRWAELGRAARRFAAARDWSAVATSIQAIHRGQHQDFVPRPSIEAHLPPRIPSKPLTLLLLINRGCNLRCAFCDLWDKPQNMPTPKVLSLLAEAAKIGTRTLIITGGEPTLHPDLPQIVREATALGMGVNITTNGTLLDRHYEALRDAGVSSLSFSIDGLESTHDQLRGQRGAYARTMQQLVRVVHDKKVATSVYFVVTRQNIHELVPTWERIRGLGSGFDFWPVNDAPSLSLRPEDQDAWEQALATIGRHDPQVAARKHYYQEGFWYHTGGAGPVRCLGLIDQYGVSFAGDLLPCCVWGGAGLKMGNVFTTPLSTLWYATGVQKFREQMYSAGCTAGCYNHSLYEFTASTGESHRVGPAHKIG